jgi:uncharacterized damage-inducible protein DinB
MRAIDDCLAIFIHATPSAVYNRHEEIQPMSIAQSMLPEFDMEMANTRNTLARMPEANLEYKPDPKSMGMAQLAGHIAEMVGWTVVTCTMPSFDIPADFKPFIPKSTSELLATFDQNATAARAALAGVTDEAMMQEWSLSMGGKQMMSMPRIALLRGMIMNHIIHHRAQLTVYYRLNGVAVPALYGPSADEQSMSAAV